MKMLVISLLTLSQLVFAQNDLQTIKEQNPSASNREVLKIFYHESFQAAELDDFDKGDNAQSNQECRMVHHSTEDRLNSVVVRKLSKTIPSNGPLFPSKTEDKLYLVEVSFLKDGKLPDSSVKTFEYISMDENAYDLIVHMRRNSFHADSPFKLFLRKSGDLISFKMLTHKNNQDNGPLFENNVNEDYGYCWKQ